MCLYYYGARYYDPKMSLFISVDPLAEQFQGWSPYNYTMNNPLNLTDPTGMAPETPDHIIIRYKNEKGKSVGFRFDGKNAKDAPKDKFVQDFLEAYEYNVGNGGGDNMKKAATDKNNDYYLFQNDKSRSYIESISDRSIITWNNEKGLELDNGDILSPATILEHEFDHGVNNRLVPILHQINKDIKLDEYDTMEELRVIMGSETRQAKLNGELSPGRDYTRKTHRSGDRTGIHGVKVEGPISTKKVKK